MRTDGQYATSRGRAGGLPLVLDRRPSARAPARTPVGPVWHRDVPGCALERTRLTAGSITALNRIISTINLFADWDLAATDRFCITHC